VLAVRTVGAGAGGADREAAPEFVATYQRIAKRRGTKIAKVAVARKLLTRACHLLADAQHAAPEKNQNTMRVARAVREPAHRPGGSPGPGRARPGGMSWPPSHARSFD